MSDLTLDQREAEGRYHIVQLVLPAMFLPFFASILYYVLLAGTLTATLIYVGTKILTVAWPVAANHVLGQPSLMSWRWWRPRRYRAVLPAALGTGCMLGGLIVAAYLLTPAGDYVNQFAAQIRVKVGQMGLTTPQRYVAFCVCLSVFHSLIEEFFWRWFIFGHLRRVTTPRAAWIAASMAFAAHHFVVLACYFPAPAVLLLGTCVALGGALWCFLYARQRTLVGCWISHGLVDVGICLVGYMIVFG
jgi:hypothetical protein